MADSFQAAYCRPKAVAPAGGRADLLRRTVYPHARGAFRDCSRASTGIIFRRITCSSTT